MNIFMLLIKSSAVYVYDKNRKLVRTLGEQGVRKGQLNSPASVALDDRGLIWVSDEKIIIESKFLLSIKCFLRRLNTS